MKNRPRLSDSQREISTALFEEGFVPRDADQLAAQSWMTMDLVGEPSEHSYNPRQTKPWF